jgi:hypothetical protein
MFAKREHGKENYELRRMKEELRKMMVNFGG